MKTKNITFSMPISLINKLQTITGKRGMSRFVVLTLEMAIEKEIDHLRSAYSAAEKDPERKKTIKEWSSLDSEDWE